MPSEDRDRLFERALARQLRADPSGASLCLDPETLAAYHERMLSPEEMAAAKSHLVECARCQEILAQLEATQAVNQWVEQPPRPLEALPASVARKEPDQPGEVPAPASALPREKVAALPRRRFPSLGWVAPAGAIAAGLLLWVGVREFRSPPAPHSAEIAENRSSDEERAQARSIAPEPQPPPLRRQGRADQGVVAPQASPALPLGDEKKDLDSFRESLDRKNLRSKAYTSPSRQAPAPGPRALGQAQALEPGPDFRDRLDHAASGTRQEAESADAFAIDAAKPAAGDLPSSAPALAAKAPPPPPPGPAEGNTALEAAGGSKHQKKETHSSEMNTGFSMAVAKIASLEQVAAPGGKKIWRLGAGGEILHSGDGGRTWTAQRSGVSAELSSGSAPSDKVCWIAGRDSTLLRTTDGGKHWSAVRTPFSADLAGVRATDAEHATIWSLPDRLSYETSDGGVSWQPVPHP
jgi:Photosynthesis system II assembly factor YCF48